MQINCLEFNFAISSNIIFDRDFSGIYWVWVNKKIYNPDIVLYEVVIMWVYLDFIERYMGALSVLYHHPLDLMHVSTRNKWLVSRFFVNDKNGPLVF